MSSAWHFEAYLAAARQASPLRAEQVIAGTGRSTVEWSEQGLPVLDVSVEWRFVADWPVVAEGVVEAAFAVRAYGVWWFSIVEPAR